jgi:hypothetical protein
MKPLPGIIEGRAAKWRHSAEYLAIRERIRSEAHARRGADLRAASFWRRMVIRWTIEREVRAVLDKIYPPGALYAAGGSR